MQIAQALLLTTEKFHLALVERTEKFIRRGAFVKQEKTNPHFSLS